MVPKVATALDDGRAAQGVPGPCFELPAAAVADARRRLHRVAGQVEAVDRMLAQGRECREVLTQLAAATKALERARLLLLAAGVARCLEDPEAAAVAGYPLEVLERLFLGLS